MNYKNFKWKFANGAMKPIGMIFGILTLFMVFLFLLVGHYDSILIVVITMLVMLIPTYFIFLLVGDILYHNQKLTNDEEGFYQNKRFLRYDNIRRIYIGQMGQLYSLQLEPIKDGFFVSKRVVLYFESLEEVLFFIVYHDFSIALSYQDQYTEVAMFINDVIEHCGDELHPSAAKLFNAQKTFCDCCGNRTIFKRIPNDVCHVCRWINDKDPSVQYNPNTISDLNGISLIEAKRNYERLGYIVENDSFKKEARKPFKYELPDYVDISNDN